MVEFKRNKETGMLEAWKDGKKVGEIRTMGDGINSKNNSAGGKRCSNLVQQ